MNAMPNLASRPLLDLLGARWKVAAPVSEIAWTASGVAGFGLGDGTLAMARPGWEGGPAVRPRDGGGMELVPASTPAPPAARATVHAGACLSLAADPDGGFLTGGDDGQVARVQVDGGVESIARFAGVWAAPVAAGRGFWRACATGRIVHRLGASAASVEVAGPVAALAVDPAGARLAIGHEGGVTLWAGGDTPRVLAAPGTHRALAWSPDSSWLASATQAGGLHVWRLPSGEAIALAVEAPVRPLAAMAEAGRLVAGVGGRVVSWRLPHAPAAEGCGIGSKAAVTRLACHPRRGLLAAGYQNGAVLLCQPGSPGVLFARGADDGAVSALAWSPDGEALAVGTESGEIALLTLPESLFRAAAGTPQ